MATLKADKADAESVAKAGEAQAGSAEQREAMKEWSPTLGKIDDSNKVADAPGGDPEKMSAEEKVAKIRALNATVKPKLPCVEMEIVGRAITHTDKEDPPNKVEEDYAEQTIFFPTVGNKDIETIRRYRDEKGYAVVGYHNFPPEAHPKYVEFEALKRELDGYISPPEARRKARK